MRRRFCQLFPDFLTEEKQTNLEHEKNPKEFDENDPFASNMLPQKKALYENENEQCADILDDCVDKMCSNTTCANFIHNIDRLYLKTLGCFIFTILFATFIISIWYYTSNIYQCEIAMSMSIKIIGERTRNLITNEFWIAQMITNNAISSFKYNKKFTKSVANSDFQNEIMNGRQLFSSDKYLASFNEIDGTENIWAFWVYNNDTNGFVGAYRTNEDIIISAFNGTCRIEWFYNTHIKQRDLQRLYQIRCGYTPRERPWYKQINDLGIEQAVWTEPYKFATNAYAGATLVSSFMDNGTLLILLTDITVSTLIVSSESEQKRTTFNNLPVGTILMTVTSNLDVILSSQHHQVDISGIDEANCVYTNCKSSNDLIVSSMAYVREYNHSIITDKYSDIIMSLYDYNNGYYVSIFPFKMLY
eukprot:183040_1